MNLLKKATDLSSDTLSLRRALHACAELGLDQPNTHRLITEALDACGIPCQKVGASLCATLGHGSPTLLLRADTDAIPGKEESGLPFASMGDAFHGCGHDLHAAMLVTAARILKEMEASLPGQVLLLFQAGEETLMGAKDAIDHGLLRLCEVDANAASKPTPLRALALHVAAGKTPIGEVFYNPGGVMMSSADRFKIEIRGKGGHGAYPSRACNPIDAAVAIHEALLSLPAREAPPEARAVLSICRIEAGKTANVIPQAARMEGTLHVASDSVRKRLTARIPTVVRGIAEAMGVEASLALSSPTPPLICDADWTREVCASLSDAFPDLRFREGMQAGASEDFAHIASHMPAAMLYLSAGFADERGAYTAHHPMVVFDEDVLPVGAAMLAHIALHKG